MYLYTNAETQEKARSFIMGAHGAQRTKSGENYYYDHLLPVAYSVPQDLFITALAHDILEDTSFTESDLTYSQLFHPIEVRMIVALTKRNGESYYDYLLRIRDNPPLQLIKAADIRQNLRPDRLEKLDDKTAHRLRRKYGHALHVLFHVDGWDLGEIIEELGPIHTA